ncbi:Putative zn(2)-C6 fungal-type DNA-binding domain-containing protein [Septoria linicola]|uniref:Zn(2)-C6 fungal-type DNA-binding domain-containing protein n=1 Tax=Septoria linicola TaxID=215465 RepID=A0A9Q9AUS8_9PEZI|nr:putative zn(2)-C6 fungal-type DNA-binding domain-containing protein [Septoria linicola]USW52281.1 Putative zn(2)-C6 fungal-type DNA-binding domain-containing protein [Septoria linicola]
MSPVKRRKNSIVIDTGPSPGYARQTSAAEPYELPTQQTYIKRQSPVMDTPKPSRNGTRKRSQVRNACMHCRNDKVKCSGTHPTCTRCSSRDLACDWDVPEEGITKTQHLQNRLAEAAERLDRLDAVVDILRYGTDSEASEALARLRFGESLEEVLDLMGTQSLGASKVEGNVPNQIDEAVSIWPPQEAPVYDPLLMQSCR